MAIKIYNKGGTVVVEDGTDFILSQFAYYAEGDNITVQDKDNDNQTWNINFADIQNEAGSSVGASVGAVLDYIGALSTAEIELLSSTLGFSTSTLLTNGQTYDSTILDLSTWTQVQTNVLSDKNGTIVIDFVRDAAGTDILRTLTIPYVGGSGFKMFSSVAFTPYVRYRFTCDETGQTDFYFDTKFTKTSLSPQILDLNAFVSSSMVATMNRSLLLGQDGDGSFSNVSVVETSNDDGTYHSLQVVDGARPSQLFGRVKVSEVVDTSVSVLQRTITTDKTFFVTDIILTVDNTDNSSTGRVNLRDGLTVAGATVLPMLIQESPTNESAVQVVQHSFNEPIEFSTGLFIEEGAGINTVTGVIIGYEE